MSSHALKVSHRCRRFPSRFWHVPCWATLSKILFEGTKKPIGWFALKQHRDRHSVSRPPFVVAAREASCPHPGPSTHFDLFFEFFFARTAESLWLLGLRRFGSWKHGGKKHTTRFIVDDLAHSRQHH